MEEIASVYARSLFEVAKEQDKIDKVRDELGEFADALNESRELQVDTAGRLKEICARLRVPFIFKSSYDKANRSSGKSFRGPGMQQGLAILAEVKKQVGVPVLTDVHAIDEVDAAALAVESC